MFGPWKKPPQPGLTSSQQNAPRFGMQAQQIDGPFTRNRKQVNIQGEDLPEESCNNQEQGSKMTMQNKTLKDVCWLYCIYKSLCTKSCLLNGSIYSIASERYCFGVFFNTALTNKKYLTSKYFSYFFSITLIFCIHMLQRMKLEDLLCKMTHIRPPSIDAQHKLLVNQDVCGPLSEAVRDIRDATKVP